MKVCECPYGRVVVPPSGPDTAKIMLIGEAPGAQEVQYGRPFIGPAGQLLDGICQEAGIDRRLVHISNTTQCVDLNREDKRPTAQEIDACWPRLEAEIAIVAPKVIIAAGAIAAGRWFPGMSISRARGKPRSWNGIIVLPTFHPARAMAFRNPEVRPWIVEDFQLAKRLAG